MLPREWRLRTASEFTATVRAGRRASGGRLTVHLLAPASPGAQGPARAGLVVGKGVGGSVIRHRVSRRLRALLASRIHDIGAGSRLVVRASPGAATASSAELAGDLDAALARVRRSREGGR